MAFCHLALEIYTLLIYPDWRGEEQTSSLDGRSVKYYGHAFKQLQGCGFPLKQPYSGIVDKGHNGYFLFPQ